MQEQFKEVTLEYVGKDVHDRPVYKEEDGRLWKDVDPRPHVSANLCLCAGFGGEPDMPMDVMKKYKDAVITFKPQRITW